MSETIASNPFVGQAIDMAGGDSVVSRNAGLKTAWAVSKWRVNLPDNRVLWLSEQTGWKITPHKLSPAMYPNATDGLPKSKRAAAAADERRTTGEPITN